MAIDLTTYDSSASISTTEYSLLNDSTTLATITTDALVQGWIDFGAMTAADEYEVKFYETAYTGGSKVAVHHVIVAGLDGGLIGGILVLPSLIVGLGWDVTVKKLSGTDRTIGWNIRLIT